MRIGRIRKSVHGKKKGTSHGALFVDSLNESLKLSHIVFGYAFGWCNVIIVEQIGEHILNSFAFR